MGNGQLVLDDNDKPVMGLWDATGHQVVAAQALAVQTDTQAGIKYGSLQSNRSGTTVLNQASAAQIANGNSADLSVGQYSEMSVDANITVVSGTATPSLQLFIDRKGADGIYYPIWQSAVQTATGQVSTSIGAGMSISQSLGSTVRLRWTITGTTPSFTFSSSLIGK